MPDFWQLPTVSMGLGPIMAIYQARFLKYLTNRELTDASKRKVWCFMGDGECDEPESLGAISLAGSEKAGQPGFRGQLQPPAPRRSGARQRQDHPGARRRVPGRGLERHQGHLGQLLGSAAGARQEGPAAPAHGRGAGRRLPEIQGHGRRLRARAFLRRLRRAQGNGRRHERRGHLAPQPRRPRPAQDLCRLP